MNAEAKIKPCLSAALVKAFAEIEGATKDKINPHFKSKYADIGSVIDAIKPILAKHDLAFTQHPQPSESGVIIETILHHAAGETLSMGTLFVPANKNDAQGFGSALTYARRYALMTAFGVPAEDDDGNAAAASAPARNGHQERQAIERDTPFPQGPCKNKTELKDKGRAFWRDVEAADDTDELEILLADKSNLALVAQLMKALPDWWDGGTDAKGEAFEGLDAVITRRRRDFEQLAQVTPMGAGAFGG